LLSPSCHHSKFGRSKTETQKSLIQKGCFYIGKRQRIREVILDSGWCVDWRDIDPKPLTWLAQKKGSRSHKSFASWATRKVEPEEIQATPGDA
jgi:hypothetical protein